MSSILKVDTIQDQSGNNIINENADTITIGASGDTITIPAGATFSATITAPVIDEINDTNGNEEIIFTTTASAVNELTIANAATGNAPEIAATGDDTNIDLRLNTKGTGGVVFNAGAVGTPSITTTGDTNTGIFFPAADNIAFTQGGTEAMRIISNGAVGIGTTGPDAPLDIRATDSSIRLGNASQYFRIQHNDAANALVFNDNDLAERMRIASDGYVIIGRTSTSSSTPGIHFSPDGQIVGVRGSDYIAYFNRQNNDGNLVLFAQADATEGTISVSGATVSYNGFTGSHWSRFIDESKPDVLRGTVMESLDQMTDWYHAEFETSYTEKDADGNDVIKTTIEKKPYALKANEQEGDVITYNFEGTDYQATIVKEKDVKHVMSKISDTVEAKNVYGVFHAWDNDDLINNDFYVASVGSYVVRIKAGQTVSKGDLLQSNGDGTAKVQADDIIRASTFAKVLSNTVIETYEDGSFIVPCSLMC
jgi:hypothetical protein